MLIYYRLDPGTNVMEIKLQNIYLNEMHIFEPTFNSMFIANGSKASDAAIALVPIQLKVYGLIIKTLRENYSKQNFLNQVTILHM